MRHDVIVVGAGPAGSTTARECASRGLSVLMLDKAEFPRDKPCGGGVTVRAAQMLPFDLAPVVERTISGLHLTYRQSKGFTRYSENELALLTRRSRLDAFLLERALEAGATLRQRATVRAVEQHPSHVVVRTGDATLEARTLVAADGANGPTARMAGIDVKLRYQIALEGNISPPGGVPEQWQHLMGLDVGGMEGGYGWIFPKGDHLNIGLGGWKYIGSTLRQRLERLVRHYGYDPANIWGLSGFHLPVRQRNSPLVDGNLLLVGDAAGLIDPVTAEGIHSAFWSGQAAARNLAAYVAGEAPDLDGYRRDVERDLVPDLAVSRQFHDLFHLSPALYVWAERHTSLIWGLLCRIMRGEQTYSGAMRSHPFTSTLIAFVSDLVRVSPRLQRMAGLPDATAPERFFVGNARHPPA